MKFKDGRGNVQEIIVFHWSASSPNVYLTNSIEICITLLFLSIKFHYLHALFHLLRFYFISIYDLRP
jgi:hypothetical protein